MSNTHPLVQRPDAPLDASTEGALFQAHYLPAGNAADALADPFTLAVFGFGVNAVTETAPHWLQVPLEEFLRSPQQVREVREPRSSWSAGLGYEDNELFKIYLRLPVPKRRLARDVILAIARAHEAEEAERAAGS